jgi:branched-chain amino acid transport system substrate-binding protein
MLDNTISRREFLKRAGVAGAAVGAAGGLGGLLAACGGGEATTTTAAAATTTSAATATTAGQESTSTTAGAETTTSASAAAESGRPIKIGFVSPITGKLATFGTPDKYCLARWDEYAKDGLVLGDQKNHAIQITLVDSQSSVDRASQVAGDLINNTGVDMIMVASTPDTTVPVSDQAESFGVPCISNDTPWQAWFNGRKGDPKVGFKWTYHCFWGQEDIQTAYFAMWDQFPNNKVYGALWPNDADGNAYRKAWPPKLAQNGYKLSDPGAFEDGLEDYTKVISTFKKDAADICAGVLSAPDFTNFWTQSKQQGYNPKAVTVGKALQFWQTVAKLGEIGYGLTTVVYWTPTFPFKSSLTGETCQEFADEYEKRQGEQWVQPLYHYALFEMAVNALKRTSNLDDKAAIATALSTLNLETLAGPVDFTLPVQADTRHPVPNVYRTVCAAGQWVKGTKYPVELKVTSNAGNEIIPVEQKTTPLA